jgi:hypothetical protein
VGPLLKKSSNRKIFTFTGHPNLADEWLGLLLPIREVTDSSLSPEVGYPKIF